VKTWYSLGMMSFKWVDQLSLDALASL